MYFKMTIYFKISQYIYAIVYNMLKFAYFVAIASLLKLQFLILCIAPF